MRWDACSCTSLTTSLSAAMVGQLGICFWERGGPEEDGLVAARAGPLFLGRPE